MRLIGRSFRLHPRPHAIAISGAVGFSISVVALSRAVGWLTDTVIVPGLEPDGDGVSDDRLLVAFLVILGIAAARGLGAIVRRYYLAVAEYRTGGTWRGQLFHQYMAQPMSFHRSVPTGQLLAHVDNDLTVATIVLKPLAFAVATIVLAGLAIVNLALLHPLFGLIAVVLLPVLAVINRVYSRLVAIPAAEVQRAVADVTSVAHESFDGVMVVKTLGRQDDEVARLEEASAGLREKRLVVGRLRAVFEPLLELLPNLGVVALLVVGAWLVDRGSLSVGDVIGAMTLFTVIGLPIRILGFFLQSMPLSVVALERIDSILGRPLPAETAGERTDLPPGALSIDFDSVEFSHGDNVVLDRLDLSVDAGETLALVGATGSGKSTLLDLAAGLIAPDGGDVSLGNLPYGELAPAARSDRLAMVFQETFLFAETIGENITLGEPAAPEALERAARLAQAHAFIEDQPQGYDTLVGERGVTLSGGQRQRVALARALYRNPSILLLDDATSAVDPAIEADILDGLRRTSAVTLVIVAHRLSTILLADRVAFLDKGRIAAFGTHRELLAANANYERLVRAYDAEPAAHGAGGGHA